MLLTVHRQTCCSIQPHYRVMSSKPVFVLTPQCCVLSTEAAKTNFIAFDLAPSDLLQSRIYYNQGSTKIKVSIPIKTPPRQFFQTSKWNELKSHISYLILYLSFFILACINTLLKCNETVGRTWCTYKHQYIKISIYFTIQKSSEINN